ncbi:MAG: FimV/HubP family polar landmark protein [Gammaproteobacteria bacterium]
MNSLHRATQRCVALSRSGSTRSFIGSGQLLEAPQQDETFETAEPLFPTIPLAAYREDSVTDSTGQRSAAEAMDAAPPTGDLDYGITQKGDSLWKIAEKLRGDHGVTVHQVMMALLRSNPSAFINDNVHRMKVGQVLRIEDASLLTAMSAQQAAQEYLAQTESWEAYRQQIAAADTAIQPEVASDTGYTAPAPEDTAPTGELVLASPEADALTAGVGTEEGEGSATGRSDADLLREEVRQALRDARTEQGQNTALNERLRELEGELDNLQRSLTVQDDELAALQQQLSEASQPPAPAVEAEAAPETPLADMAESQPSPESSVEADEAPAAQDTMTESEQPEQQEAISPTPVPPVAIPQPAEPGFMDKAIATLGGIVASVGGALSGISIDPMYLAIIGGAVVVLLILIVVLLKRRKRGNNFEESILTGAAASGAAQAAASGTAAAAVDQPSMDSNFSEESSFLSDFAISGAGAIQTEDSEVDPLTEADVFMAYGRHEAAEERLLEAVKQDPNRKELKLKLLELYNTTKNREAFEPLAEEFYASLGDSANGDPMWEKVLIMGAEIAADNPLFGNAPATGAMHKQEEDFSNISNASMSDSQVMDIGLDTGVFSTTDFEAPGKAQEEESSASLDFNLDFGDADSGEESTASMDFTTAGMPAAEESTSSLDFNLSDDEDTAGLDIGSGMDFELDSAAAEEDDAEPTMTMQAPEIKDDDMSLDFDMGETPAVEAAPPAASEEFTLDIGAADSSDDSAAGLDLNLDATDASSGMDDFGSVDEVGTKLDLAKAYIDMGDPEGARSILDEVMEEGNDSQKQEAQQLIQQIV